MSIWIDFKSLRAKLDFEQVLKHYGVEIKRKGKQHHGFCPLPDHNGKKNSPSFSANLEKGIFQCFGCGAKGNVLDFAAHMEKADPKDGAALRDVALKLQQRFCPELGDATKGKKAAARKPEKPDAKDELPVVVNQPLDFELKGLDAEHPYLLGRGFTPETIEHFGLGFCSRGLLKDRVAIAKIKEFQTAETQAHTQRQAEENTKAVAAGTTAKVLPKRSLLEKLPLLEPYLKHGADGWKDVDYYIYSTYLSPNLPKFLYYDEYYALPSRIDIEELNAGRLEKD